MTRAGFCEALTAAIVQLRPTLPAVETVYPRGPLLRFHVPPPTWVAAPGILDPIGLVWYARTGQWRGLLTWLETGTALGLTTGDVLDCVIATDGDLDRLGDGGNPRAWRVALLDVIDRAAPVLGVP